MGPALDLEAAKQEYEQMFDLQALFQMEPDEQQTDESGEDGHEEYELEYTSSADSARPERSAQLTLNIDLAPGQSSDEGTDDTVDVQSERRYRNDLDWSVVDRLAKLAFDIWTGQPELIWAKKAFDVLAAAGLVEDTDAFSRQIAIFRVLALGGIYRDFCDAAWQERSWIDYAEWCEPDEIADRFVIGQLFAKMPDWDEDEEVEFSVAVDRLVEAEREVVVEALRDGFGGSAALYERTFLGYSSTSQARRCTTQAEGPVVIRGVLSEGSNAFGVKPNEDPTSDLTQRARLNLGVRTDRSDIDERVDPLKQRIRLN